MADYICYSIHGGKRIVAVIIETKKKFSYNSIAQLLGYYYRVATDVNDHWFLLTIRSLGVASSAQENSVVSPWFLHTPRSPSQLVLL